MSEFSIGINFALGIFNLIPLPPLDGSKVVEAFLPYNAVRKYEQIARYSFLILLGLLWLGAFRVLAYPIIYCSDLTLGLMAMLFRAAGAHL